jgi:phosphohistidine swiveling domain-containing protein
MNKFFYKQNELLPEWTGGKAQGLNNLYRQRFRVPEFYVFPNQSLQNISEALTEWNAQINPNENTLWAVRSSANVEDGKEKSYAGLFSSVLNCNLSELPQAFAEVAQSFEKIRNTNYHIENELNGNIILQKMINPAISGVGFSVNPTNYESENPVINILPGLGTHLVSGEENALLMELLPNGETIILSDTDLFHGKIFLNGKSSEVSISKNELFQNIKPFLPELRNALLQLEKTNDFPVDTEFVISENELYWLQVRPITQFFPKTNYTVWDNSNISVNYPGIVLPTTSSFVQHEYGNVYKQMFVFLGAGKSFFKYNEQRLENMLSNINGALYYNITVWQQLLYQMPFGKKTSQLIAGSFGADEAKFEKPSHKASFFVYGKFLFYLIKGVLLFPYYKSKYLKNFNQVLHTFDAKKLQSKTHNELISEFKQLEISLTQYWFPPMLNGFYTMLSYNGMRKVLSHSRLQKQHPNLLNDALSGSKEKVVSVEIVRSLQQLLVAIEENGEAKKMILESNSGTALQILPQDFPEIYRQITLHIERYGERCEEGELKLETINYREDESRFIDFLRNNLKTFIPPQKQFSQANYKEIIRQHYRFNFLKKWFLYLGIEYTIKRVRDRENFRFIRTKSFHLARQIFRAIDKRLLAEGNIENHNDSLYLTLEELCDISQKNNYISIIGERKKLYETYRTTVRADRYYESNGSYFPMQKQTNFENGELRGIGCSSGIVQGEVVLVNENNAQTIDSTGKILVAKYFEPGWIGLFVRASGLISEKGSLLSHTAILCREMKIPAIVGAKNCLEQLQDGELVRMDGASGEIKKLNE